MYINQKYKTQNKRISYCFSKKYQNSINILISKILTQNHQKVISKQIMSRQNKRSTSCQNINRQYPLIYNNNITIQAQPITREFSKQKNMNVIRANQKQITNYYHEENIRNQRGISIDKISRNKISYGGFVSTDQNFYNYPQNTSAKTNLRTLTQQQYRNLNKLPQQDKRSSQNQIQKQLQILRRQSNQKLNLQRSQQKQQYQFKYQSPPQHQPQFYPQPQYRLQPQFQPQPQYYPQPQFQPQPQFKSHPQFQPQPQKLPPKPNKQISNQNIKLNQQYKIKRQRQIIEQQIIPQITTRSYSSSRQNRSYSQNQISNIKENTNKITNNNIDNGSPIRYYIDKCYQYMLQYRNYFKSYNKNDFQQFIVFYQNYSKIPIIGKQSLKKQVQKVRNNQDPSIFYKLLLIVDSALYYKTNNKHRLRPTQILAIYLFLYKIQVKRLILQILTGQGKSITIACIAAILTIKGYNVDIITTNKLLAERDAQQQIKFFQLMGLQCTHNVPEETDAGRRECMKPRQCYAEQKVVYGTPFSFQVDLLYDQYQKKQTRNKRPYDVVIIDEVDSMLLDKKSDRTMLSKQYTGYYDLIEFLRIIWQTTLGFDMIRSLSGTNYILMKSYKQGQIIKADFKEAISLIQQTLREKFKNQIINQSKLEFINISLAKWIQNAICAAFIYKQNKHYIVQDEKIVPVDFQNTGCLRRKVSLEWGLHQFLQMKHGLHVDVQTVSATYISNMGHFSKYQRVYGLTGTLGSHQSMKFLQKIYNVEMFEIPPFKQRRLKVDPGFAMFQFKDWIQKMCARCAQMMDKKRAVLIICQSIHHAESIADALELFKVKFKNIRVAITGEEDHGDEVDCGDIIVATNVAGRGTDFKPTKMLVDMGGLHVIVGFMPANLRVEMQARGRAGRNGAAGSSELIVDLTSYYKSVGKDLCSKQQYNRTNMMSKIKQVMKNVRDVKQAQLMKYDYITAERLTTQDQLFSLFCETTNNIEGYCDIEVIKQSIQEEWAILFRKFKIQNLSNQQKKQKVQEFINRISNNSQSCLKTTHTMQLGTFYFNFDQFDKAKQLYKSVQNQQFAQLTQFSGLLGEAGLIVRQLIDKLTSLINKEQINKAINKIHKALAIIRDKRQLQLGLKIVHTSIDSKSVIQMLAMQKMNDNQRMSKICHVSDRYYVKKNIQNKDKIPMQMQRLMNNFQDIAFQIIIRHLQTQLKVLSQYQTQKQRSFQFRSINNFSKIAPEKQLLETVLKNLSKDISFVPFFKKRQKCDVQIPGRQKNFCLSILLICAGALFSLNKQFSNVTQIVYKQLTQITSILFSDQKIKQYLQNNFNLKSISYANSILNIGHDRIIEQAEKKSPGFKIIKNSSVKQIFKQHIKNIKTHAQSHNIVIQNIQQRFCFKNLHNQVSLVCKEHFKTSFDILNIVSKQQIKQIVLAGINRENSIMNEQNNCCLKLEKSIDNIITNKFQYQISKKQQIKRFGQIFFNSNKIQSLVKEQYKNLDDNFKQINKEEAKKQFKKYFFDNIANKNLISEFITKYNIDKMISHISKKIIESPKFNQTIIKQQTPKNQFEVSMKAVANQSFLGFAKEALISALNELYNPDSAKRILNFQDRLYQQIQKKF